MPAAFATLADLAARHPAELVVLAADETTGLRDDARVEAALADASAEMRGILQARYTPTDLEALDADSRAVLAVYAMDIALYRVALSFARSSDRLKEARDNAVKRLEAIASGKGGLTVVSSGSTGGGAGAPSSVDDVGAIGVNGVVIDAPERIFTRGHFRRS